MNYPYVGFMKNRKSIRLPFYDYSFPGEYFITVCVKNRLCLLGEIKDEEILLSDAGTVVFNWISNLALKFPAITVNHFVIMPNHIHLIIEIAENKDVLLEATENESMVDLQMNMIKRRKMLLPKAIGYLKMNSAKEINSIYNTSGTPFWQSNYYEHIIRDENSFNNIVRYINDNPLNWHPSKDNS